MVSMQANRQAEAVKSTKWQFLALFVALTTLQSCDSDNFPGNTTGALDPNAPPIILGDWYRPGVATTWQWQLQGVINTAYDVDVYDIDLFDASSTLIMQLQAEDKKVICYFSAGSYEAWRTDAADFEPQVLGEPLDGWPDERWLDIREANVHEIMKQRLDLAVQKGCDGVEPDNLDAYTNDSGFLLNATNQLAFNRFIANEAHLRGLSVGLKNDLEQVDDLVAYYDFAVNEQCHEYQECSLLTHFIDAGKPVLHAEYHERYIDDENARNELCTQSQQLQFSTLILPLDLNDAFRWECE